MCREQTIAKKCSGMSGNSRGQARQRKRYALDALRLKFQEQATRSHSPGPLPGARSHLPAVLLPVAPRLRPSQGGDSCSDSYLSQLEGCDRHDRALLQLEHDRTVHSIATGRATATAPATRMDDAPAPESSGEPDLPLGTPARLAK